MLRGEEEMRRVVRYRNGICVRDDFLRTMEGGYHLLMSRDLPIWYRETYPGMSLGLTYMVLRDLPRYEGGRYLVRKEAHK